MYLRRLSLRESSVLIGATFAERKATIPHTFDTDTHFRSNQLSIRFL